MHRLKIPGKRNRRTEIQRTPSSEEEPAYKENKFDKCPILMGKSVDFASFTFDAHSFQIEEYFMRMGWISVATLEENVYSNLIKELYSESGHNLFSQRKEGKDY